MARYKPAISTTVVSDITIRRQFEICCNEHGVIDQTRTWADAVAVRRDHFLNHPDHKGGE